MLDWARARGEIFDHCIVGEPTNVAALGDTIKIGRRGSLNGRLTVRGKQGHSAHPHRARNPSPAVARIVTALSTHVFDEGTEHFDRSNLEVTSIDIGNGAANVIPGEARARFNIRFNNSWTLETLQAEIRRVVAQAAGDMPAEVEFLPCNSLPFLTAPGDFTALVADAIEEVTGRRPGLSTSGGTSDARFITRDCPVLEFGLVNESIHAVDEHARIDDVDGLAAVYGRVIEKYFTR
jgi:succinyl-diaminopimelate desuccinylase